MDAYCMCRLYQYGVPCNSGVSLGCGVAGHSVYKLQGDFSVEISAKVRLIIQELQDFLVRDHP